jgi:hypothetical protein
MGSYTTTSASLAFQREKIVRLAPRDTVLTGIYGCVHGLVHAV